MAQEHVSRHALAANLSLPRMQARRDPCNVSKMPDLEVLPMAMTR
jgi:hypothetical protein